MNSENSINTHSAENDFSFKSNKEFYLYSIALLGLWLVFCWQGLVSAVQIWYGNEIFNHGFFIVPGAIYLIYLKRKVLLSIQFQTSAIALVVIIPALLLYVIGIAGDVQLFMHTATFTLLPALIWLMLGTKAAKTILFPLVFMLFSIPVGEQLTPYLQEIAADGSVALLQLTGIPLFRSGLFIEIPQGRFLVAEACSGVSFFIASFVIGSLYAYLNLVSVKRRVAFVSISLILPVLANVVRVYGIILIAYWTDMEYAAGADHLIYGWFFFAFVIVCLLGVGELMREPSPTLNTASATQQGSSKSIHLINKPLIAISVAIFFCFVTWKMTISSISATYPSALPTVLSELHDERCASMGWKPVIINPDEEESVFLAGSNCRVKVYSAWFSERDNELVSDLHRLFDPERFSLNDTQQVVIKGLTLPVYHVVSLQGQQFSLVRWYELNDRHHASAVTTKLQQLKNQLLGQNKDGRMWIVALKDYDATTLESIFIEVTR